MAFGLWHAFVAVSLALVVVGCGQTSDSPATAVSRSQTASLTATESQVPLVAPHGASPTASEAALRESTAQRDSFAMATQFPGSDAWPTMSPAVATAANTCIGDWRTGDEIVPGRNVSAMYADGFWHVGVVGLWYFEGLLRFPTPPGYTGPTREPWQDMEFVVACDREIHAETARLKSQDSSLATATPPTE